MHSRKCRREDLMDRVCDLAQRLGRTPGARNAHEYPDIATHVMEVTRFRSWRKAPRAAGIAPDRWNASYGRDTLVDDVAGVGDSLGQDIHTRGVEDGRGACIGTANKRSGSCSTALAEDRLELKPRNRRDPEDELLCIRRAAAQQLGQVPTMADLWKRDDLATPSIGTYRFGRWKDAPKSAALRFQHLIHCAQDASGDQFCGGTGNQCT